MHFIKDSLAPLAGIELNFWHFAKLKKLTRLYILHFLHLPRFLNGICEKGSLLSDCAYAQADLSLSFSHVKKYFFVTAVNIL